MKMPTAVQSVISAPIQCSSSQNETPSANQPTKPSPSAGSTTGQAENGPSAAAARRARANSRGQRRTRRQAQSMTPRARLSRVAITAAISDSAATGRPVDSPPVDSAAATAISSPIAARSAARSISTSGAARSSDAPVSNMIQRIRINSPTRPGVTVIAKPPR